MRLTCILPAAAILLGSATFSVAQDVAPAQRSWSSLSSAVTKDVQVGRPVVVYVVVPLCSNRQINCGSTIAGIPGDLAHNIYWGAIFGARRIFDRKDLGWTRVSEESGSAPMLQKVVYRKNLPTGAWSLPASSKPELLVVLQAVHGDNIDDAVSHFMTTAVQGGQVTFNDAGRSRTEKIHVVGYAGHNRLMDKSIAPPQRQANATPIPSFVLACESEKYFGPLLRPLGSSLLATTRTLMAPEGYLIESAARAIGDNASPRGLRAALIGTSVQWQKIPEHQAAWIFQPYVQR